MIAYTSDVKDNTLTVTKLATTPNTVTTTYTYDGRFNLLAITDACGINYLTNTYGK